MKEEPKFVSQLYTIVSCPDKLCIYIIMNKRGGKVVTEVR